jgi:transposase-like protein
VPPRLPDDKRAAILADIKAGTKGRAQIARDHGVNPQTVGNIAKRAGVVDAFSRLQTENATRAAAIDSKALRVSTARRFLDKTNELLDQMDEPHLVFNFGGKDNTYEEHLLKKPPTGDLKNLMVSAATAIDKHLVLERHDSASSDAASSLLDAVANGLQTAYESLGGASDKSADSDRIEM